MNSSIINHLYNFSYHTISLLKEKIVPILTDQQKRILTVVFLALSCLAACYAIYKCSFKKMRELEIDEKDQVANKTDPKPAEKPELTEKPKLIVGFLLNWSQEQIESATQLHNDAKNPTDLSLEKKLEMAKIAGECLTSLSLKNTDVTNEELKEVIDVCPNLKNLNLSFCNITNAVIKDLPRNLEVLNLLHCDDLTNEAIKDLPRSLQELDLSHNPNFTDDAIKELPENLSKLNLSWWSNFNDHHKPNLRGTGIKDLPKNLIELDLSFNAELSDTITKILPRSLQKLNLYACDELLTDASIKDLPEGLQVLQIGISHNLTDAALKNLPIDLCELDLFGSANLTDTGLSYLPKNLRKLNLGACDQVTQAAIKRLADANKELMIVEET